MIRELPRLLPPPRLSRLPGAPTPTYYDHSKNTKMMTARSLPPNEHHTHVRANEETRTTTKTTKRTKNEENEKRGKRRKTRKNTKNEENEKKRKKTKNEEKDEKRTKIRRGRGKVGWEGLHGQVQMVVSRCWSRARTGRKMAKMRKSRKCKNHLCTTLKKRPLL